MAAEYCNKVTKIRFELTETAIESNSKCNPVTPKS